MVYDDAPAERESECEGVVCDLGRAIAAISPPLIQTRLVLTLVHCEASLLLLRVLGGLLGRSLLQSVPRISALGKGQALWPHQQEV